jgi:hypothetical protein
MTVEARLQKLGLVLPQAPQLPPGTPISFAWTRVRGNRVYLSGQGPLDERGAPRGPFGKIPSEVSLEEAQEAARGAALSLLGALKRELGDLDRVVASGSHRPLLPARLASRRRYPVHAMMDTISSVRATSIGSPSVVMPGRASSGDMPFVQRRHAISPSIATVARATWPLSSPSIQRSGPRTATHRPPASPSTISRTAVPEGAETV